MQPAGHRGPGRGGARAVVGRGTTRSSASALGPCRQSGNGVLLTFVPDGRRFNGGDATLQASVFGLTEDGDVVVQSFDTIVYVVDSK